MLIVKKTKDYEDIVENFIFKKYKFKNTNNKKILFIANFCELGVETLSCMYSIPKILEIFKDYYVIVVGWSGREYFYRHLCNEFWELSQDLYWLKDKTNAFCHNSRNLDKLEKYLSSYGTVFKTAWLGNFLVGWVCRNCLNPSTKKVDFCSNCKSLDIIDPLLDDPVGKKFLLKSIPKPPTEKINYLKEIIPTNSVAVFARNRKTYGRNLDKDFYLNLNKLLREKNLNPIYLGENSSSLNMKDCIDFSATKDVNDLSFTLSVLSCVKFSIQMWTASTRLSSIVETPFILVESPEQMAGRGFEGLRIAACNDFNKKKIIFSNYINFLNNTDVGLSVISKSIQEVLDNNWSYVFDMVEDKNFIYALLEQKGLLQW